MYKRQILYRAAQRVRELHPVIPLYHHASRHLVGPQVAGWQDNVRDLHPSRHLDIVEPEPEPEPEPEVESVAGEQPSEAADGAAGAADGAAGAADGAAGAAEEAAAAPSSEPAPAAVGNNAPATEPDTSSAPPRPSERGE